MNKSELHDIFTVRVAGKYVPIPVEELRQWEIEMEQLLQMIREGIKAYEKAAILDRS